jgi:hypothetical protein
MHSNKENAVVEAVVVIGDESVDVRPLWVRGEKDL